MSVTIKWVTCIECGELVPVAASAPYVSAVETPEGWVCTVCSDPD